MTEGHIYIIKMSDLEQNKIYKIYKSINVDKTLNTNLNNNLGILLTMIKSNNINYDKCELLKLFNINFTLDKGKDFFRAESDERVLKLFIDYFLNKYNI
jgi:hypothetical protein